MRTNRERFLCRVQPLGMVVCALARRKDGATRFDFDFATVADESQVSQRKSLMPAYTGPSQRQRAVSLLLVSLLHALLLFALLRFLVPPNMTAPPNAERLLEMIIRTGKPPEPRSTTRQQERSAPLARQPASPSSVTPPVTPPLAVPDLRGFGRALQDCAPENLSNLTQGERMRCPGLPHRPDANLLTEPPSHVKDPAMRAAEMGAKNAQPRIPCTYIIQTPGPGGGVVPMIDPLCGLKGASGVLDH
jgi:hypothetical protein